MLINDTGDKKIKLEKHISDRVNTKNERVSKKTDKEVRKMIKVFGNDVKVILDIGANIGTFSLSFANRLTRDNLKIYN